MRSVAPSCWSRLESKSQATKKAKLSAPRTRWHCFAENVLLMSQRRFNARPLAKLFKGVTQGAQLEEISWRETLEGVALI